MFARLSLVALLAVTLTRSASAQAPVTAAPASTAPASPEGTLPTGRAVNGHVFMPSAIVAGALVTTSFTSHMVIGLGTTSTTLQVGDRQFSGDFTYAGLGAALGYEYAFTPNLSARFSLMEAMYSGIDGPSVITVGTSLQASGTLGATWSVPVGDSLRLGVLFDAGVAPGFALTIGNAIRGLIEACEAGDCSLDNTESVFALDNVKTYQPAIAANWVPWRPLGITANAAYLYASQKQNDDTVTGQAASLGLAADLDFNVLYRVPIGLQLMVNWVAPLGGEGLQHVTDMGGGIFYTGREHLAAGIQFAVRRFKVQNELPVDWSAVISNIGLRYYW